MKKGDRDMTLSRMMTRTAIIAAVIAAITLLLVSGDTYAAEKKIKTYYTGIDMQGTGFTGYTIRHKVVSYYQWKKVSYSKKREVGEIRNNTGKKATKTLSVSRATTRTYSISLSAVIPKSVVKNDISATIGGSISFNNTITISAGTSVPAYSTKSVYLQYKTSKCRYRYVVQKQIKSMYGKWRNIGKPYTKYNISTTKVPVLVL